jgi:hypothetical protein
MPQQLSPKVENSFTKGFITEFTGMNFPENAATDTDNCIYTLIGDVIRREGFDYEANFQTQTVNRTNKAVNTYKWENVGGDGQTQIIVTQIGNTLYFYRSSSATTTNPLSKQLLVSTINISAYLAAGSALDPSTVECQFTSGNGFLFVFHPYLDPFYCTYNAGSITAAIISIQIRDFTGIIEPGVDVTLRPGTLTPEHQYNLTNQGWTAGGPWTATSTDTLTLSTGSKTVNVQSGLGATVGQHVSFYAPAIFGPAGVAMSGTVTNYVGSVLTVFINSVDNTWQNQSFSNWRIQPNVNGYISAWQAAIGNYPSNSDVWWRFKDSTNTFNPATQIANVTLSTGPAPKGHYVLNAFNQQRSLISSTSGLTDVTTSVRPRTGCWFQGRIWYAGVDASQPAVGDAQYYTWTENIYFSQIVVDTTQFPKCYQTNDPTSEDLFNLLPTDGGVITIQGCGSIYKLFPLMNALLVFAANGVWYVSGNSGIGFTADDYSIVKLSAVKSISSTSFVDINGLPMFWNEEGIYQVEPAKQGQGLLNSPLHVNPLEVNPITVGTILTFYNNIPLQSKKFARGVYDPQAYIVQWLYKSANETSVTDRYAYDSILNLNNYNKAFYPYSFNTATGPTVNGITYVSSPGGTTSPNSVIKYFSSVSSAGSYLFTFAEERDTTYTDWVSSGFPDD